MKTKTAKAAGTGMPEIVADAFRGESTTITFHGKPRAVVVPAPTYEASIDLTRFPDAFLVALNYWLTFDYLGPRVLGRRAAIPILCEANRRDWPDGWWEDPSVIPSITAEIKT